MNTVLLVLVLGCTGPSPDAGEPVAEAVMSEQGSFEALRACVAEVRARESEGTAVLSEQVRGCYDDAFVPLSPLLRRHDPQRTLELEYEFGRLAEAAGRRKAVGADAEALVQRVEQALAEAEAAAEAQAGAGPAAAGSE